jgi:vacuolar-type H+-ATPase subunit B/Vma2
MPFFRKQFEDAGVFPRTVMFVNQASDPVVERLQVPDMALAVAEKFAVEEGKRVLVLLTDMTAFADAMKEVSIAMERCRRTGAIRAISTRSWRGVTKRPATSRGPAR